MQPSRLDSWKDRITEENKALKDLIASNANSFDVFRNIDNDGFGNDGNLVRMGSINGSISDKGDDIEIITDTQFVVNKDILKSSLGDFQVIGIDRDTESDTSVLKVVQR